MVEKLQQHKIIYPDGKEEIINHYGMFPHQSGGFAFYQEPIENIYTDRKPYIFISGANVRKIIPLGEIKKQIYEYDANHCPICKGKCTNDLHFKTVRLGE